MPRFVRTVTKGEWMVLIPGAVAYLRYKGAKNPKSPEAIYALLDELGFLEVIDRTRSSILSGIHIRLGRRYEGSVVN